MSTEAIKNIQESVNKPTPCIICGGTFFYQQNASQFTISDYGVRTASVIPQSIYICLCGEPFIPKNTMNMAKQGGERYNFIESVKIAQKIKLSKDATKLIANLASITEVETLQKRIEELETKLNNLIDQLTEE